MMKKKVYNSVQDIVQKKCVNVQDQAEKSQPQHYFEYLK